MLIEVVVPRAKIVLLVLINIDMMRGRLVARLDRDPEKTFPVALAFAHYNLP